MRAGRKLAIGEDGGPESVIRAEVVVLFMLMGKGREMGRAGSRATEYRREWGSGAKAQRAPEGARRDPIHQPSAFASRKAKSTDSLAGSPVGWPLRSVYDANGANVAGSSTTKVVRVQA